MVKKEKNCRVGRMCCWAGELTPSLNFTTKPCEFSWRFYDIFPLPWKTTPAPACLLLMDVNVILGDQIFEPFETRELGIIMKMEVTDFKSPNPNSNPFLCCWMIYHPRPYQGQARALWVSHCFSGFLPPQTQSGYHPLHQVSFKSSLIINLPDCHDVAGSS